MWWKRKKKEEEVSRHHYCYAHVALQRSAMRDPFQFLGLMLSPKQQEYLQFQWKMVREAYEVPGDPPFDHSYMKVHAERINDFPAIVIEMPPPVRVPEAHLVCFVLEVPLQSIGDVKDNPDLVKARYFTLEKGEPGLSGPNETILCEWRNDTHLNYGDGPEPTAAAMLEHLSRHLYAATDDNTGPASSPSSP
ncbi:MAG: hypothetical protein KDA33_01610 [Phycisphaerales bacterium]|nr:hypothetical protein [Phycisphaerales bacterium]